jgi:hypothetical protein
MNERVAWVAAVDRTGEEVGPWLQMCRCAYHVLDKNESTGIKVGSLVDLSGNRVRYRTNLRDTELLEEPRIELGRAKAVEVSCTSCVERGDKEGNGQSHPYLDPLALCYPSTNGI